MEAFVGGAWRTPGRGEALVAGSWRRITRGEVYRNGAWRALFTFVPPLSLTANDVDGAGASFRPTRVTSQTATATPIGGYPPYTYSWATTSGGAVPANPNSASTAFYEVVGPGATQTSTAVVACVDALGSVANAYITITLTNDGGF